MIEVKFRKKIKGNALVNIGYSQKFLSASSGLDSVTNSEKIWTNNSASSTTWTIKSKKGDRSTNGLEGLRVLVSKAIDEANGLGKESLHIAFEEGITGLQKWVALESAILASYQFLFLKSKAKDHAYSLKEITLTKASLSEQVVQEITYLTEAVYHTRDLVNWPQRNQTATDLANAFIELSEQSGFGINVLNEAQIESMKMGGILAVNQGSTEAPTFSIMEWKPKRVKNKKPLVLVGKGIVYDTGGLSIKTMPGMATMKCDMHGAATVGGLMYAIAKNKLPLHVIGLVPSTDNWVGKDAYAPGDVIKMFDGTTVEILNTDAEGRLILADALHYAKKFNPELVLDFATLTGAAVRAIGTYGTAVMGTVKPEVLESIKKAGNLTYERVVEFPLWPEYTKELKSEIADMTNLGKSEGGAQSAGSFLKHFTKYPWVHLDIAGPSWQDKKEAYRTSGGSGVGVRMIYNFLKSYYKI